MSLSINKLKRMLVLLGVFLVPIAFLSVHFFIISNAQLKVEPKPKKELAEAVEVVEIDMSFFDIAGDNVYENTGIASYYADKFHNRTTASGEIFNMNEFSAAHKSLPFGTILRVTDVKTNRSTLVRINDRGPYIGKRIIDLSKKSAQALGTIHSGTANVKIEGFLAGRKSKNIDAGSDFIYAYSLNKRPVCVPYEVFDRIDSSTVFNTALAKLKMYDANNIDNEYYLLQKPEEAAKGIKHKEYFYIVKPKTFTDQNSADKFLVFN